MRRLLVGVLACLSWAPPCSVGGAVLSSDGLTFSGVELRLLGFAPQTLRCEGDRAVVERGPVREWVQLTESGLEHGFDVATREAAERLVLEVRGARARRSSPDTVTLHADRHEAEARSSPDAVTLRAEPHEGEARSSPDAVTLHAEGMVVAYDHAHAFDADGRAVPITLEVRDELHLAFVFPPGALDRAKFPLVVDPLLTVASWDQRPAAVAQAGFGTSAVGVGDVDGDGFDDVVVGAPRWSGASGAEGRAWFYRGTASGLSTTATQVLDPTDQDGAHFGERVAALGDVNADGFADVAIAAPGWSGEAPAEGRVYVYLGSATGLGTPRTFDPTDQSDASFGAALAGAGDVDGDGRGDLLVGAPGWDGPTGLVDEGRAWLFLAAQGTAVWVADPADQAGARFGAAVGGVGDVNRDGRGDFGVGAPGWDSPAGPDEGRAYVFFGAAVPSTTAAWSFDPADQAGAHFGAALSGTGDVDGDTFADLVISAPDLDAQQPDEGRVWVVRGGAGGLSTWWVSDPLDEAAAHFGFAVAGVGDVNGDGFADVMVGSPGATSQAGRIDLYLGGASLRATASFPALALGAGAQRGASVASAGDVNGDGFGDVIVGAPLRASSIAMAEGSAEVLLGYATGPLAAPSGTNDVTDVDTAHFGWVTTGAGDVNGDGFADVLVTAPMFTAAPARANEGRAYVFHGGAAGVQPTPAWFLDPTEQNGANFGRAAAGVGDVDGDGFDDVLIGCRFCDGQVRNEGKAFFFRGGAMGVQSAMWTAEPTDQMAAGFGVSVSGAGDVNGDGFADFVAGAFLFDAEQTDEGRAYLFLGSLAGPVQAAWVVDPTNQATANFGVAVAGAGDVNGDGFSDVLVTASGFDAQQVDEGRAYLYLGGVAGLATTSAWTADPTDSAGASFGYVAASAGDVNGDGFGDVLISAPYWNGSEGRVYLYLGTPSGLAATAAWVQDPTDVASSFFGWSVAGAGDVNGDGYGDVVIGASDVTAQQSKEGRAFLYLGGPMGLSTTPAWTSDPTDQALAYFGNAAGGLGDVNGDGFSDFAVGAPYWDGQQPDEGRVFWFYGGDGAPGRAVVPSQWRQGVRAMRGVATSGLKVQLDVGASAVMPQGGPLSLEAQSAASGSSRWARWPAGLSAAAGSVLANSVGPVGAGAFRWRVRVRQAAGLGAGRWLAFTPGGGLGGDYVSFDAGVDAGVVDAGVVDAGVADAGVADAGVADAGVADAGVADAGVADAGVVDAGVADAGVADAGVVDAGVVDAGVADAGVDDAGVDDAGVDDAGVVPDGGAPDGSVPRRFSVGCGCSSNSDLAPLLVALMLLSKRR